MIKEALQALAINLHIIVMSLLITALGLGFIGTTTPNKHASDQQWRIMTMTGEVPMAPPPQEKTTPFTPTKPRVPWKLQSTL